MNGVAKWLHQLRKLAKDSPCLCVGSIRASCTRCRTLIAVTEDWPEAIGNLYAHAWQTRQHAHNDDLEDAITKLEKT